MREETKMHNGFINGFVSKILEKQAYYDNGRTVYVGEGDLVHLPRNSGTYMSSPTRRIPGGSELPAVVNSGLPAVQSGGRGIVPAGNVAIVPAEPGALVVPHKGTLVPSRGGAIVNTPKGTLVPSVKSMPKPPTRVKAPHLLPPSATRAKKSFGKYGWLAALVGLAGLGTYLGTRNNGKSPVKPETPKPAPVKGPANNDDPYTNMPPPSDEDVAKAYNIVPEEPVKPAPAPAKVVPDYGVRDSGGVGQPWLRDPGYTATQTRRLQNWYYSHPEVHERYSTLGDFYNAGLALPLEQRNEALRRMGIPSGVYVNGDTWEPKVWRS